MQFLNILISDVLFVILHLVIPKCSCLRRFSPIQSIPLCMKQETLSSNTDCPRDSEPVLLPSHLVSVNFGTFFLSFFFLFGWAKIIM